MKTMPKRKTKPRKKTQTRKANPGKSTFTAAPVRTMHAAPNMAKPLDHKEVKRAWLQNAEAFVSTLYDPFDAPCAARYPTLMGAASTTFTHKYRDNISTVLDAGTGDRYAGFAVSPRLFQGGAFMTKASAFSAGHFTWITEEFPVNADIATNFYVGRPTSIGVRLHNVAELYERGGTLYVGLVNYKAGSMTSWDKWMSVVTIESLDAAKLGPNGVNLVWIPIGRGPIGQASGQDPAVTGLDYIQLNVAPSNFIDSSIVMLWKGTGNEDLDLHVEIITHAEAIPYPYTAFLFDVETVESSDTAVTAAMDIAQSRGATPVNPPSTNWFTKSLNWAVTQIPRFLSVAAPMLELLMLTEREFRMQQARALVRWARREGITFEDLVSGPRASSYERKL
jgi:hypothetical protein